MALKALRRRERADDVGIDVQSPLDARVVPSGILFFELVEARRAHDAVREADLVVDVALCMLSEMCL